GGAGPVPRRLPRRGARGRLAPRGARPAAPPPGRGMDGARRGLARGGPAGPGRGGLSPGHRPGRAARGGPAPAGHGPAPERGAAWLAEDRPARAAEAFRQVIARDELHEPAWRQLMTSHARMGERSQALRLHQRLAEVLRRELDAEPDAETTALHERLQQGITP